MKSLTTWFCLLSSATVASDLCASSSTVEDYRKGNYMLVARELSTEPSADPVLNYYLGLMRLYGYGQLKNNILALRYFIRSAEAGYLPAERLLASYYLNKAKNAEMAFKWYQKAAAANNLAAQMYVAGAYLFGYGVKKNEDLARKYYIEAAKSGSAIAQYTLADQFLTSRDSRNRKMGVIWLTKAAEKNDPKALCRLGSLYLKGELVPLDKVKAKSLLEDALAKNVLEANVYLGDLALSEENYKLSQEYYEKAASKGNLAAQYALGKLFMDTKTPLFSTQNGYLWMLKAAQAGYKPAQLSLAAMYKDGKGVTANKNIAKQWEDAAKKTTESVEDAKVSLARWLTNDDSDNFDKGEYRLGGIYSAWQNPLALASNIYNSAPQMNTVSRKTLFKPKFEMVEAKEIPIDEYFDILAPTLSSSQMNDWSFPRYPIDQRVDNWLRDESLVLDRNLPKYQIEDKIVYENEPLIKPFNYEEEKLENWQHQAHLQVVLSQLYQEAILGVPSSQFELGQLYEYGIGVAKDIEQAIVYYELAAAQQDMRAEYNLGILYLEGKTNAKDSKKGIDWLTDAAFKGNSYSQYVLGNIYEKGLKDAEGSTLSPPNHQQAMAMYSLAAANRLGLAEFRLADFLVKEQGKSLSVVAKQNRNILVKKLYDKAVKHGVPEAILPLAFYNAMDKNPAKQLQAFDEAKREAAAGNSEAALLLGLMYDRGLGVAADKNEAFYWYNHAGMNPVSTFILGTNYSLGLGVDKNIEKGRSLLKIASDAGFSYANLNLAVLNYQSQKPFLEEVAKAREQGNTKASLLLADYYLWQSSDPKDINLAKEIYNYLAEKGDKDAETKLAFLFDRGLGTEVSNESAALWYTRAAEQGQPLAQYLLGQLYQLGRISKEPDYAAARKWYQLSEKYFAPAAVALGFIYDTVENDYQKAAQNYELAANLNNPIAKYNLGLVYENGKGRPVDYKKAKELYLQAANLGYAKAMTQLASLYFSGVDGEKNAEEAFAWYQKAANLGEEVAKYHLGLFAETGVGQAQDYGKAIKYYQEAALEGNDKAKLALARMYQYGIGMAKDYQRAADVYKDLAKTSNGYAQYQLGLMYLNGLLGERQPDLAKNLLSQAKENGCEEASAALQSLEAEQNPKTSYIEPAFLKEKSTLVTLKSPEAIYFEVISEWNSGNEFLSRSLLAKLIHEFPDYEPAKLMQEKLG